MPERKSSPGRYAGGHKNRDIRMKKRPLRRQPLSEGMARLCVVRKRDMNTNKVFAQCFNFFRRFKVKENRVTLIEKLNTGGTGSLFAIQNECERQGLPLEFHVIRHSDYKVSVGNLPGLIRLFTKKAYWMATSSRIFLNDNFMPMAYMDIAPETITVQLWHGMGSFKKFGGSTELEPGIRRELEKVNEKVDYILASSEHVKKNYAEAFCVPEKKILTIGCPQADYYFEKHDLSACRRRLEEEYPRLKGKKLVLYAPTFRGEPEKDRELLTHFDFDRFEKECGKEYCLAVRLHPQIQSGQVPKGVLNLTDYPNVRSLLRMTDLLIADYSSIAVEYALLGRPILLYAFDKDWYLKKDRGFYFDFETTAPGPIARTMDELIKLIREKKWDLEKVKQFARLHNDFFDADSSARVVNYFFGEKESESKMKIIAGLGNPTDQYKGTRHNIGFMAIDKLSEAYGIPVNQHKFKAMTGSGLIEGQRVLLMKPLTYMNLSGESIRAAVDFYKAEIEDVLVIYDDISLDPGMLRIRKKGSAGGHNGMKSIIKHLGGDTFLRIRVGIGGERHPGQDLADYVLGHFPQEELVLIEEALSKMAEAVKLIVMDEISEAMNRFSVGKKKRAKENKEVEN